MQQYPTHTGNSGGAYSATYGNTHYPPAPTDPNEQQPQAVTVPEFAKGDRWGNPFDDNEDGVLLHNVTDGDTLMGLSLTYGVTSQAIKKANGITSDEIYYLGTIKIPRPKRYTPQEGADDPAKVQADRIASMKQAFKNRTEESDQEVILNYLSRAAFNYHDAVTLYEKEKTSLKLQKRLVQDLKHRFDKDDRDDKIATFYLELSNWDFEQALQAYKSDLHHGSISPMGGQQPPQHVYSVKQTHEMNQFAPMPYKPAGGGSATHGQGQDRFIYSLKKER